jgi:DNA adenine methylase
MASPILKWAGGKRQLLEHLAVRVPGRMRRYVEPFAGGAALYLAIADADEPGTHRSFEEARLADLNEELVVTYRAVASDVDEVIRLLRAYEHREEVYYATRALDVATLSPAERAARMIFLNKTCFNGLWRVNSKGLFNVPFGRYANPKICDEEALRAAAPLLARAQIACADFHGLLADLGPGDFVYFDPPYAPVSETADFTSYAKEGFGHGDQERLAHTFRALAARGVLCMLSNADTPLTRALYADFAIDVVHARRSVNSKASRRGAVPELVVTSWAPRG